jgi:two-component system sensor histidine kinase MtrB
LAFVLVAGLCAGALAVGSFFLVREARLAESVDRTVADARYQLVLAGQFTPLDADRRADLLRSVEASGHHVLLVEGGAVTASSPAYAPPVPGELRARAAAGELAFQRVESGSRPWLLAGGRVPGERAELYLVVSEEAIYADLSQLGGVLGVGWLAVVGFALLTGRLVARRTLEPVGRASAAARAVAEGLLDTRLPPGRADEFGAWAESFNRMAAALEAKIAALSAAQDKHRRFTADVAHELRTPVSALVAEAALLREELEWLPADARRPAELLVADVVRLRHLIDELMEISRLDAGSEPVRAEPVDVAALIADLVEARGWSEQVTLDLAAATVATDPRRFARVVGNLVDNAVEHGRVGVSVSSNLDGERLMVDVADAGPGIPPDYLPYLFERFSKGDPSRAGRGSGLGMAIAQANAELLGGAIEVHSEPGRGSRFRFTLPVALPLHDGEVTVELPRDREADRAATRPTSPA